MIVSHGLYHMSIFNSLEMILCYCANQWRAEAVGCPGPTRFVDALDFFSNKSLTNIFYSSREISDDLSSFSHFLASVFKFHENSLLRCTPAPVLHAPVTTLFFLFLSHDIYLLFLVLGTVRSPDDSSRTVCPTDCSSHGLFVPLSYKVHGIKNLANNCFINPTSI